MSPEPEIVRAARYAALEAEAPTMSAERFHRRQFLSMLTGISASLAGYGGFRALAAQETDNRIPKLLRTGHEANESLWRALFRDDHLARTYDRSASSAMRINGRHGLDVDVDVDAWELQVLGPDRELLGTHKIADVHALPKVEMTVEHKCVEGWSHIVTWGGTPFSNFYDLYADRFREQPKYAALWTPDRDYYVGMDIDSMMHPQTMLTWEIEGQPLSQAHGAPLRLSTPLKYGIKQIKRIGTIQFTNEQPDDYWFERGYDWYSHL